MLDAGALADIVFDAHNKGRDVAGQISLRRYHRSRYFANQVMITALDSMYEAFKPRPPLVRELRSRALNLVDAASPLKHQIMRQAMGVTGDIPSLAR